MLKDSEGTNESSDKSAQKKYYYLSKASALSVNPSTNVFDIETVRDFSIGLEPLPQRGTMVRPPANHPSTVPASRLWTALG
jgi:hypothetical protein